jgi:deoxyguanosine kinase
VRERSPKRMDEPPRYIAVEGPIGAGKSTLAELLALEFNAHLLFERFEENPFLQGFYEDRKRLAFQTQIFFLLSRYRQQQELLQTDLFFTSIISDYVFAKDRIFATLNLSDEELKLYDQIERALGKTIPLPDVIIYLQSSVSHLEENIKRRGRPYEKNLSRDYLADLVHAYNDYFFHYRESRLIVVDTSTMDFLHHPHHLEELVRTILRSPHPPVEYITVSRDPQPFTLEG